MRTIVLTIALFSATAAAAQNGPAWTSSFGSFSRPAGLAVLRDESVLVAYTSSPCEEVRTLREKKDFFNRMAVAKVDRNGTTIFDVEIPRPEEEAHGGRGPSMGLIGGIAALDDGDFVVFAEFTEGRPWMLRLDEKGGVRFMKPLAREGLWHITSVIRATDGALVYAGHANGDLLAGKISDNGRPLWHRKINAGNFDSIVDLAAEPRGGLAAVGISAAAAKDMFFRGDLETIVLRFDESGNVIAEARFNGRSPALAASAGKLRVLYDRGGGGNSALRLKTLDAELKEIAEEAVEEGVAAVAKVHGVAIASEQSHQPLLSARAVAARDAIYVAATTIADGACIRAQLSRIPTSTQVATK